MAEPSLELLTLLDSLWFRHLVLHGGRFSDATPLPAAVPEVPAAAAAEPGVEEVRLEEVRRVLPSGLPPLRRSLSHELPLGPSASDSAILARHPLKLETILSGKAKAGSGNGAEGEEGAEDAVNVGHGEGRRKTGGKRRTARSRSQDPKGKSLSELEFEELRGFMELGFTFPETAESDQRLLSLVPGLRRRSSSEEPVVGEAENGGTSGGGDEPAIARRPYLSEAWDVAEEEHEERRRGRHAHDHLLRNWRLPAAGEGVDIKDHLRSWAHAVASAVR